MKIKTYVNFLSSSGIRTGKFNIDTGDDLEAYHKTNNSKELPKMLRG